MTSIVQGDTLVYQQDGNAQTLAVGTPAWYSWLETASTFAFASDRGTFTARRERSGHKRGGWYWKAYRKQQGKLSSTYLGKPEGLTLDRLNAAAQRLAQASVSDSQATTSRDAAPPVPGSSQGDPLPPLLATKLHRPLPRAQLVRRPHLTERLTQGVAGPLTLISAPAGFGKTTLLAQWIEESGIPVAWLSLEREDNDPVRFLTYLIAALQTQDPQLGVTCACLDDARAR